MALNIKRKGYGQVEPNHLSAQYTGQIYAQLPAMTISGNTKTAINQLENGQFLKYNYKDGVASVTGDGEWMLVYNEEKRYDPRLGGHKDFCVKAEDMMDKTIYPRLLKTNIGDIFTTNTFGTAATGPNDVQASAVTLTVGNKLYVGATGFLTGTAPENYKGPVFQVVKEYNLADMQNAVKIQRIE